ncbi:hypothetical protein SAMN05216382_1530 [Sphingomonas palmae]|uniref:Uncharacterized protein n=1 Tax=Sphingomonas palmae TaxID=1855283 RepID=A0A1H7ML23_9SPHN|nr:hypothetical protein [Sphingomonas palmae]SEL11902.1 hypothetical protein SAMN05216382_1530 [Sphingomonas palmae]
MTDPLDLDRFRDLADAYGGVVARWPVAHRAAAARVALTPEGRAILADALLLDARLDQWTIPAPAAGLAARIGSKAAVGTRSARIRQRWWWSGFGLAATLAGVVAGTAAVAVAPPVDMAAGSTSFGDVAGMEG